MSKAIICMYHISIISIKNLDIYQGPLQNIFFFLKKWNFCLLAHPIQMSSVTISNEKNFFFHLRTLDYV